MYRESKLPILDARVLLSCLVLTAAVGLLSIDYMESLYPTWPFFMIISVVIAFFALFRIKSLPLSLLLIALLSLYYSLVPFLWTNSLIGMDPFAHAAQVQALMYAGSLNIIPVDFYSEAAQFQILTAIFGLIASVPGDVSMIIWPIIISLIVPTTVAAVTRNFISVRSAIIVAVLLSTFATSVTRYSYWPDAQIISAVLWATFILSIVNVFSSPSRRNILVIGLILIALSFSHKISILYPLGLMAFLGVVYILNIFTKGVPRDSNELLKVRLSILIGVLLTVQWVYLTGFIDSAILLVAESIGSFGDRFEADTMRQPEQAEIVRQTVVQTMFSWINMISLFTVGGAFWLYLYINDRTSRYDVILSATAVSVGLVVFVGVLGSISIQRLLMYAEVTVPIVIVLGSAFWIKENPSPTKKIALSILVIVILVSQIGTPIATPDGPNQPRYYFNSDEINAEEFTIEYVAEPVDKDYYFAGRTTHVERVTSDGDTHYMHTVPNPWNYPNILTDELYDGNIDESNNDIIAYRTNTDVYLFSGMWVRLDWDLQSEMNLNYNKIYHNSGVVMYDTS